MSTFLRGLKKLGLVEIDEADDTAPTTAEPVEAAPPAAAEPLPAMELPTGIEEGRPFEAIYEEHRIGASPYPAEKLLKVLDGLRAMDAATRKIAVLALDQADESWTVEDAVLDAQRKIKALEATKKQLQLTVRGAEDRARAQVDACEQQLKDTVARIRQQIADLEGLLARETEKAGQEKAGAEAGLHATRDASVRETARMDAQIAVLRELPATFGGTEPAATPAQ